MDLLDLDAIETPVLLQVKLRGKIHELAPVTVDSFVSNIKLIQQVGRSGDVAEEIANVKKVLLAAFPTMTEEDLGALTLEQLRKLSDAAQEANGQKAGEKEAVAQAEAQGDENPQ